MFLFVRVRSPCVCRVSVCACMGVCVCGVGGSSRRVCVGGVWGV